MSTAHHESSTSNTATKSWVDTVTRSTLGMLTSSAKAESERDTTLICGAFAIFLLLTFASHSLGSGNVVASIPGVQPPGDTAFLSQVMRHAWAAITGLEESSQHVVIPENWKASSAYWGGFFGFAALAVVGSMPLALLSDKERPSSSFLLASISSLISCVSYYLIASNRTPVFLGPVSGFPVHPTQSLTWLFTTAASVYAAGRSSGAELRRLIMALALNVLLVLFSLISSLTSGIKFWISTMASAALFAGAAYSFTTFYRSSSAWSKRDSPCLTDIHHVQGKRAILMLAVTSLAVPFAFLLQFTSLPASTVATVVTAADLMATAVLICGIVYGVLLPEPERILLSAKEIAVESFLDLKQKNSVKNRFFASMVHELRTPLHGIVGLCEILEMTESNHMSHKALSTITTVKASGRRLQELISTILDSTSMQEAKLRLTMIEFSLPEMIEDIATLVRPMLKSSVELVVSISPNLPLLEADMHKVRQVLYNLLGNAVKFTNTGQVTISACVEGSKMCISVEDTGAGIPEESVARIFRPFEQADNSTSKSVVFGGTGLGLSLAKCLVEAHDGQITVSSTVGKGSKFTIVLPLRAPEGNKIADVGKLHSDHIQMQEAVSSSKLERVVESPRETTLLTPAAVPVPHEAPKTPENKARIRNMKTRNTSRGSVRSQNSFASDPSQGLLQTWLAARKDEAAAKLRGSGDADGIETIEVLCVDDEPINQTVIRELLQSSGFRVTSAMSGPEALEILEDRAAGEFGVDDFPNLVLMDFMMPEMTGIETTKMIRSTYSNVAMPIVMLSANDDEDTVVNALSSGCSDYINKPFKSAELLARVGLQTKALMQEVREVEAQQHEQLLGRILPKSVIERLKSGQNQIADNLDEVTIVFSDIVGFTSLTSQISTEQIVQMLDQLFVQLDQLTDKHGVYKVETIGDCYMVAAGIDEDSRPDHSRRALAFAMDMIKVAEGMTTPLGEPLQIRVGMHSGSVAAGVVGLKCPRYCLFGDTVNTASRMESTGFPMCIQLSNDSHELAQKMKGDMDIKFHSLGPRPVKGKGEMTTFLAEYGNWEEMLKKWEEKKQKEEQKTKQENEEAAELRTLAASAIELKSKQAKTLISPNSTASSLPEIKSYPYRSESFYLLNGSNDKLTSGAEKLPPERQSSLSKILPVFRKRNPNTANGEPTSPSRSRLIDQCFKGVPFDE